MVQINWTKLAVSDLNNIYEFIAKDSKSYAKLQLMRIKSSTRILVQFPSAGRVITEIKQKDFREIIEGNYRIIYKIISSERIDILTIHHSARDMTKRDLK